MLAVSSLGIMFVILGVIMLIIEVNAPGFFIGLIGSVLIVLGIITAIYPDFIGSIWSPVVVVFALIVFTYLFIKFYASLAPPDSPPETSGTASMVGEVVKVIKDIVPDTIDGIVSVHGREWSATTESDERIPAGTKVIVTKVEGVHLVVKIFE